MRTLRPLPEGAAERWAALLQEAKDKAEYQRIQCVWLRAALGLRAAQMTTVLGWQAGSVRQVHSDHLRHGEAVLRSKPAVHHSVVYRALHRQGWRKMMPHPPHPKASEEARETLKSGPTWSRSIVTLRYEGRCLSSRIGLSSAVASTVLLHSPF
jgi:hypothetical protein